MADTFKHAHQSALPDVTGDVKASDWNANHVAGGGVNGQIMTRDSTQVPHGWKWADAPVTYTPPAPALSAISQSNQPGTLNVSSVGTLDWLVTNASTTPRTLQAPNGHWKAKGGWLAQGFDWICSPSAGSVTFSTFSNAMQISSSVGDDVGAVLTNNVTGAFISDATGGALNWGFGLRFPAGPTQRTMRIYAGVFSGTLTMTAGLSSGAVSNVSTTLAVGAGASNQQVFEFTFKDNEGWLWVTALLTTNQGSGPNIAFMGALVF